jgi:hypothetical protein
MRRLVFTVYFDILINWKFYCIINILLSYNYLSIIMKHLYKIILLSILIFSFACSNKTNSPLEEVLELAGSNRSELKRLNITYNHIKHTENTYN